MSTSPQLTPTFNAAALLEAVDKGDTAEVNRLLHTPGTLVNVCNQHGETSLHIAAGYGNLVMICLLCDNNASVNIRDKHGDTPLYWAARHGHLDVVQYLCSMHADINAQTVAKETALHVCARYDQSEVLAYLCQAGAQLDLQDNEGDTALHCGVWNGYQSVVKYLVGAGSSLQCSNRDGETPLHVAAVRGYFLLVQFLCDNGAIINAEDKAGCTAVHLATKRSHLDIVHYLCSTGCSLSIQNKNGDTALHDACREGNLSIFLVLLKSGSNVNSQNMNKATPLHLAAKYGHTELVRHLCVSGCDINAVTDHGFTADQVAANASHSELAYLIHRLRQGGLHHQYISELVPDKAPPTLCRHVKLLVCGAAGVGKTELVNSLKCSYLRSIFRKRSTASLMHLLQQRTYGITVQQLTLPTAGEFSVWDFSGMKSYYPLHEELLVSKTAIFMLVFSLRDPPERQLAQLRFWLAMIKAKLPMDETVGYAGERRIKPNVVLVASFADHRSRRPPTAELVASPDDAFSAPLVSSTVPVGLVGPNHSTPELVASPDDAFSAPLVSSTVPVGFVGPNHSQNVLETLCKEFSDCLMFSDSVFSLDCRLSQTAGMKELKHHLRALRRRVIQNQKSPTLRIVQTLSRALVVWREEYASFPVLSWTNFLHKTRQFINPLVSEDLMGTTASALHDIGEVVYIRKGLLINIVVLDPAWLGRQIFGPALSPENSIVPQLRSITGQINFSLLQHVYPACDTKSIAHLFEHFELCIAVDEQRSKYLFPGLIQMEPLFGLWEKDPEFTVYSGIRICCQRHTDIFSPSLFPRIQIQTRKVFSGDIEDQELSMWSEGLKYCCGGVEILVRYPELHKIIEILVRGTEQTRLDCYSLLQKFYSIVIQTARRVNPGTAFETRLLSSRRLKEHRQPLLSYSPEQVFAAERGDGILRHSQMLGETEDIIDVICCGCKQLLVATKSAPYCLLSSLPKQTRAELSSQLDHPHPLGRDWCLLALQLSFVEEVPKIHQTNDCSSPTNQLLRAWEQSSQNTVVTVIDALRAIGRDDAACTIIQGLSPFSNTSNFSLPGGGDTLPLLNQS